ncbi:MAG: hypothetical protein JJ979_03500, partial [Roseibium sp.]|nr:hypothetical protein [Roseibium sp.]
MTIIKGAAFDPALKNWAVALIEINLDTMEFDIEDLKLFQTEKAKGKQVRSSSDYYRRARYLNDNVKAAIGDRKIVFAEVPSGGQDYKSVYGFGITVGLLAGLNQRIIEVSPSEAKKAAVGTSTASKREMIDWAFEEYPDAPWLTRKFKGEIVPTMSNEHLADACAIAKAGLLTPEFENMANLFK